MSHSIRCFRCGASLGELSLPFSRRDACPGCHADVHVCKMCLHYSPGVPTQCSEDGAEEVKEKERSNFCDWFAPSDQAFDEAAYKRSESAKSELAALFGGDDVDEPDSDTLSTADKLFR